MDWKSSSQMSISPKVKQLLNTVLINIPMAFPKEVFKRFLKFILKHKMSSRDKAILRKASMEASDYLISYYIMVV